MIKPVEFTVDEQILRGNFYIPEGENNPPAVILFHGSGGTGNNLIPLAEKLMNNGIFAFFFNFRGCGESDGLYREQTIGGALKDARRATDLLLDQKVDHKRIGMLGSSFGGDLATQIINEYPIKSLVLKAPCATDRVVNSSIDMGTDEDEHNYFFAHPEKWENAINFRSMENYEGNLLLIKLTNDNIIPSNMIDEFYRSAKKAKTRKIEEIQGADHRLSKEEWVSQFTDASLEWFLETL